MNAVTWTWRRFDELDASAVYAVLKLRQDVFIIEQDCPYPDADGKDTDALHLLGHDAAGTLVAYLRLFAPSQSQPASRIGRVVTAPGVRGTGLGRALMQAGIVESTRRWPTADTVVSAQAHLEAFYVSLGFVTESAPYDEDGILHIDMRRRA